MEKRRRTDIQPRRFFFLGPDEIIPIIQRVSADGIIVQIVVRIHILRDDTVHFKSTVFRRIGTTSKADALSAIVTYFGRVQIAKVALAALDALTVIQHAAFSFHG